MEKLRMQTDKQRIRIKIPVLLPVALAILVLLSFSILDAFWLQWRNNTVSILLISICVIVGTILWSLFYVYILRIESKLTDVYMDLRKQMEKRKKAEEELQQAYDQMELDVTKRTSELSREVAERKKTEHELQELNAELEMTINRLTAANHELEQFAFITSHHLREPVRKISMFGRLLANSLADKLDNDQRENLNFMIEGATRIEQMVKGLKLYLQVSTEKMEFEDIDLNLILENIKGLSLTDELEQTNAAILVPEKLPMVSGCPIKLHQVIEQIIANGLRYRQKDTPLEIVIRAYQEDSDTVRIEIEDNGIGIREEHLQNVFDPFRRLQIESDAESVGIGLTVCNYRKA
jgi:signal transduction histidine kinase